MSAGDARADETAPLDPGQKATDTMNSTVTAETLAAIAPSLDAAARELAHSNMPDGSHEASDFAVGYVRAVAETCGALASVQCAAGEAWEPESILDGDAEAIREAAEAVQVTLDAADWRALGRLYRDPRDSAYDVLGEARPAGRYVICRTDGSLSCGLREALSSTEEEAERDLASLEEATGYDDHEVRARLVHHL